MARHTDQVTLRDLDPRVFAEISRVARVEGLSINKAAAKILKIGAGIDATPDSRLIGAAVDRFVGKLSAEEARKVMQSLRVLADSADHAKGRAYARASLRLASDPMLLGATPVRDPPRLKFLFKSTILSACRLAI